MTSSLLVRAMPLLAVVFLPLASLTGGCLEDHTVGSDDGDAALQDDGGTCSSTGIVCNEPDIGPGCHLGEPSCKDGAYQCPAVVCEDGDAGSCSADGAVCSVPPIPSGCSLGPAGCVDGQYVCPAVLCPGEDAGACASSGTECSEPDVPPGCSLGPAGCVGGQYICPAVVCPTDAGGGGSPFACGSTGVTCDSETEYCFLIQGGPIQADSGTVAMNGSCQPIPSKCANNTAGSGATCACLETVASGTCSVSDDGAITMELDAP